MGLWLTGWEVRDGAGPPFGSALPGFKEPEPVALGTQAGGFGGCGGSQAGGFGGGLSGMGNAICVLAYCSGSGLIGGGALALAPITEPLRHCW